MGDMFENSTCSSSSSTHLPSSSSRVGASGDISLLLHQILLRSSSSSSSSEAFSITGLCNSSKFPDNPHHPFRSQLVRDGISAIESSDGVNYNSGVVLSSSGAYFSGNVCSSSVGVGDNEGDEYDCESEEGLEALVEEATAKHVPSRASSKRSRAAEVHNLSEKRRRSRINEKMKALQNLIPNSNKTDKASMLDEAIEYLKQLQLQVQMLSMRNGISLHPILPGVLQPIQLSQMRIGFGEENGSLLVNPHTLQANQETPGQTLFSLTNQCSAQNQPSVPDMSNIINSETSFGLESSIQTHLGPFQLHASSEEICGQDMLQQHQQLSVNHSETHPLEFEMGGTATISLPFSTQVSDPKDNRGLEACIIGREQSEGILHTGRITLDDDEDDDVKGERRDF